MNKNTTVISIIFIVALSSLNILFDSPLWKFVEDITLLSFLAFICIKAEKEINKEFSETGRIPQWDPYMYATLGVLIILLIVTVKLMIPSI